MSRSIKDIEKAIKNKEEEIRLILKEVQHMVVKGALDAEAIGNIVIKGSWEVDVIIRTK